MVDWKKPGAHIPRKAKLASGAAALLLLGAAAGAGAASHMRPTVEMAPTVPTAIAKLPQASGVVTVKGKIAEVYGDRFILQDGSGRLLVDAGPEGTGQLRAGAALTAQGRYDNGQMRASYLVDPQGNISDVSAPPRPPRGPGRDGPPAPPPPPPGAGPVPPRPDDVGAPPPPPPPPLASHECGAPPLPPAPVAPGAGRDGSRPGSARPLASVPAPAGTK
jgi:hypothetical protein